MLLLYIPFFLICLFIIIHAQGPGPGPAPPHVRGPRGRPAEGPGGRPPKALQRGPSTWGRTGSGPGPGPGPGPWIIKKNDKVIIEYIYIH